MGCWRWSSVFFFQAYSHGLQTNTQPSPALRDTPTNETIRRAKKCNCTQHYETYLNSVQERSEKTHARIHDASPKLSMLCMMSALWNSLRLSAKRISLATWRTSEALLQTAPLSQQQTMRPQVLRCTDNKLAALGPDVVGVPTFALRM